MADGNSTGTGVGMGMIIGLLVVVLVVVSGGYYVFAGHSASGVGVSTPAAGGGTKVSGTVNVK